MQNIIRNLLFALLILGSSCTEFFDPDQEIYITESELLQDWQEYRALEMGLYGLQQKLTEQIIVLGELRGDLLTITENASTDLVEIYNFKISEDNQYASPTNFFKLISACNNFIYLLQMKHPEVLDPNAEPTNYDRLYGEVLCMRAWAYFNAVRIYGKVPFIYESLTGMEEVESYLSSDETYIDSVDIIFSRDGYYNDTIYNNPIALDKQYYDLDLIIDYFTNDLEKNVKAVGVDHSLNNNDDSWNVTVWNTFAYHALLGSMYLTDGDLLKAKYHFESIINANLPDNRYEVDNTFGLSSWSNIFTSIDTKEHIYTLWFDKSRSQQNEIQKIFETRGPHEYMLKPTNQAVMNWETLWRGYELNTNNNPSRTTLSKLKPGFPGDLYRGYGTSYAYFVNGEMIDPYEVYKMWYLKSVGDFESAELIVEGADTVVYKYSIERDIFDEDANLIIYRAAGIHFWLAEAYAWLETSTSTGVNAKPAEAVNLINDGSFYSSASDREQIGIRRRAGYSGYLNYYYMNPLETNVDFPLPEQYSGSYDGIRAGNINYLHDPYTNEVIGYLDLSGDFEGLQYYIENQIIKEKAREMAFEGERFYDLMRVAKRRNDPSFLASRVSEKYPAGKKEEIYNLLLNEENWYIRLFD